MDHEQGFGQERQFRSSGGHYACRAALIGSFLVATPFIPFVPVRGQDECPYAQEVAVGQATGRTVLVVQEGPGTVVLFSTADPSQQKIIDVGQRPHEIELAPDGETAFVSNFGLLEANHRVGTPGTTISVIDIERAVERVQFHLPAGAAAPHGLKLRPPQYQELFTNAEEGQEQMFSFDAQSGALLRAFPLPRGVHNFIFNSDGTALFAFTLSNEILRIDPDRGSVTASIRVPSPRGLAWTADGDHLLVGGKNEVLVLDPAHLSIESRFSNLGVGQIFYPSATPDGRRILAPAVLDGVVLILDAADGSVQQRVKTGSALQAIVDGSQAWISNVLVPHHMLLPFDEPRNGGVVLLDLTTFAVTQLPQIHDANGIGITPEKKLAHRSFLDCIEDPP
jgi:DNA-binding beta-propeller fold protein YncE